MRSTVKGLGALIALTVLCSLLTGAGCDDSDDGAGPATGAGGTIGGGGTTGNAGTTGSAGAAGNAGATGGGGTSGTGGAGGTAVSTISVSGNAWTGTSCTSSAGQRAAVVPLAAPTPAPPDARV
jgi:hypothetical protein